MSFPRYPKYKDSGVEWLGQVPEHWNHAPVWLLFELGRGRVISHEEIMDNAGEYPVYSSQTESDGIMGSLNSYAFDGDYLTWTTDGANAGTVFRRSGRFNCTNVCGTLKARSSDVLLDYCWHALAISTAAFVRHDINPKLMNNVMAKIRIPIPPVPEQTRIAAFLDRETAKIDALVAEQQRLMELLKEKRQAVISHAVTKGLNPKAPMKPSGIEWLGDVPKHWEITKIKRLASRISSGKTPLGGSEIYVDEGITFLRSQNIYDEGLRLDDVVFITEAVDEAMSVSRVKANDILLNITGASIGRSCVVPSELPPANVNQHVCVIRLENSSQVPFVGWLFKSATIKNQIDHAQNGAAREGLNFVQIGTMSVALPPAAEQEAITNFLNIQVNQLDTLTAEAQRAIDLLQERRTALISAAVIGQIDVRNQ